MIKKNGKNPQFMNIEVKCYYMNTGKDFVTRPKKITKRETIGTVVYYILY